MKKLPHTSKLSLALGFVLLTGLAAQVSAQETVVASQDNYIEKNNPDVVMDSTISPYLKVNSRHAYFRFDLSPTADGTQSATGKFTVQSTSTTAAGEFYSVRIYVLNAGFTPAGSVLGTSWDQTALTYNNAPGFFTSGSDMTIVDTLTVNHGDAGQDFTFTLPTLSSFLQSDDTVTFLAYVNAQSGGNNMRIYDSGSATFANSTTLTYGVVPEPSTYALLAGMLGLAAAVLRRRR